MELETISTHVWCNLKSLDWKNPANQELKMENFKGFSILSTKLFHVKYNEWILQVKNEKQMAVIFLG